jgi:hypothetical protein
LIEKFGFEPATRLYDSLDPRDHKPWWYFLGSAPILQSAIDVAANVDFKGTPLHYEPMDEKNNEKPNYEFDRDENTVGHKIAKALNDATITDDTIDKGVVDFYGGNIDRVINFGGTAISEVARWIYSSINAMSGNLKEDSQGRPVMLQWLRTTPIANRFIRNGLPYYYASSVRDNRYYEERESELRFRTHRSRMANGDMAKAALLYDNEDGDLWALAHSRKQTHQKIDKNAPQWAKDYVDELDKATFRKREIELTPAVKAAIILGRIDLIDDTEQDADSETKAEQMNYTYKTLGGSAERETEDVIRYIRKLKKQRNSAFKDSDGKATVEELDKAIIAAFERGEMPQTKRRKQRNKKH